ncbi:MAG: cupin domain-containing protein [Cellvibrionales bacterium]|nr:cupin domain-containing protein [Cellvibrionales bacterium]
MDKSLSHFDASAFLKEHWQKKPLLLKQAFENFSSPLTPDELAGLALEDAIESRIIIQKENDWQLHHGPFDETFFQSLDGKTWTLLVQSLDQWLPDIHTLKNAFDFLPSWRLDDIMISYAPTGGSVGPHFDQYDVFLLQANGQRLWQIGQRCSDTDEHLVSDVKVLANFEETERHLLSPGDILYLPPGVAHHGVSQSDDCMTISIGFRAPSTLEILDRLVLNLGEQLTEGDRYQDPALTPNHPNQITRDALTQFQQLINNTLQQPELLAKTFGELMTEKRHPAYDSEYQAGIHWYEKALDARIAFIELDNQLLLFANGDNLAVDARLKTFIEWLCSCNDIDMSECKESEKPIVEWLISQGVFIPFEEE